ncbi:unnamed protein product, partial [Coregonus sp. 'balchen']
METAHRPAHLMGLTDRMWTPMTPSVVLVLRAYYLALLASLEFLSMCVSAEFIHGLFFKPAEVRRKLLLLLEDMDCTKPLHLNMYLVLLKKLPAEDTSLAAEEFDSLLRPLPDLCSLYRQDQEICAAVLLGLLPSIRSLGRTQDQHNDMRHVQGALLQVVSGFCILGRTGKCTAIVKVALIHCLLALLEADPCCKWAVLTLREEELPVSVILPSHLSDSHRHVRMLAAMTVERLFLQITPDSLEKRKMLPLKCQQTAFENVYLKAQEGMSIQKSSSPEDPCDETFNRKATLLKNVSVVLCCSPVWRSRTWAFVLRDIIYTLIHHINSRSAQLDEVSSRSFSLCCDLLTSVCRTAVQFCDDTVESHLQVIVGTLTAQVTNQLAISQQSQDKLKSAIQQLEPFSDRPEGCAAYTVVQHSEIPSQTGKGTPFTHRPSHEIAHFLSVTRLEGLKDLRRQLNNKSQIRQLLRECLEATGSCLGELGPVDFSTIALLHGKDQLNARAAGADFWEIHKDNRDPVLAYLNPFRSTKKKVVGDQTFQDLKYHVLVVGVSEEVSLVARERLERHDLWMPEAGSYKAWLKTLHGSVEGSGVKTDFCQRVLPLIIHDILLGDSDGSWRKLLSTHIQDFFTSCSSRAWASSRSTTPLPSDCGGTVCHSNFWLELNYLEVAREAQSCSAHFTALLYSEIYVDKIKTNMEENRRTQARTSHRITFDESSQNFTISSLTEESVKDTGISLQVQIRTYEHEAVWAKALTSYDLHSNLPDVTRQVGILEGLQNFGLSSILATYAGSGEGSEVEELCRGSLEAVSSLYPALRNLQGISELESVRQLFSKPLTDVGLAEVCSHWQQHSQLLVDSDFGLVEPILALRSYQESGPYIPNKGFHEGKGTRGRPPPLNPSAEELPQFVQKLGPAPPPGSAASIPDCKVRLCGSSFLLHAYSSTSGSWRTVCSDGLADHHGKAACQHLGYSSKTCPSVKGVTLKCI